MQSPVLISGLRVMPRSTAFAYRNASYYEPVPRGHKIVLSRSAITLGNC
jgi:hypothetical protein